MKKLFLSVAVLCVTLFVQAKDYADYVSPLVGTQSSFELSTGCLLYTSPSPRD